MRRNPPFLLQRHLFGELVLNLVFSLVVITSVFFVGMVIQSVARYQDLPMSTILTVIPYFLPRALTFTLPLTMLIATVQTFGRMAADNEITAIRVGGIHLGHLISPVILLGLLLAFLSFHVNSELVPASYRAWKGITRSSFDEVLTKMKVGDHEIELQRHRLSLTAEPDGTFSNLMILERDEDTGETRKTLAERGWISIDPDEEMLLLHLENAVAMWDEGHMTTDDFYIGFSLSQAQVKIRSPVKESSLLELLYRVRRDDLSDQHLRYAVTAHKRIALSFASFFFALIGAPLGIYFRRGGRMMAFFISFLIVLIVYYPMLLLGEAVATDGRIPPPAGAWLGNAMVAGIGLILLIRVFRE